MMNSLFIFIFILFLLYGYYDIKNIYTARFFFITTWFFYTMTIPLDLTFGFKIETIGNLVNLNDNESLVLKVMYLAILSLIGFLLSYITTMFFKKKKVVNTAKKETYRISIFFIYLMNFIGIVLFVVFFLGIDRRELDLMSNGNMFSKLIFILFLFIKGLNLFFIFNNKRKFSLKILFLILLLPILQGSRVELILYIIAYIMIKNVKISFIKSLVIFFILFFIMYVWKLAYAFLFYQADALALLNNMEHYGISSIEFSPSFLIAAQYINDGNYGHFGETYLHIFSEIIPKVLFHIDYTSLAAQTTERYLPRLFDRGGSLAFSYLAESWYNFGWMGSFVTSSFIGFMAALVDVRKKVDIILLLMIVLMIRLWRTEAALLFKQLLIIAETYFIFYILYTFKQKVKTILKKKRLERYSG